MKKANPLMFLLGLISGAIVGAIAAAFLIPQSGPETREQVTERGIELKSRAEDTVRRAQDVANETVAKVQSTAQELLHRRSEGESAAGTAS
jgi:gas vesicle protein